MHAYDQERSHDKNGIVRESILDVKSTFGYHSNFGCYVSQWTQITSNSISYSNMKIKIQIFNFLSSEQYTPVNAVRHFLWYFSHETQFAYISSELSTLLLATNRYVVHSVSFSICAIGLLIRIVFSLSALFIHIKALTAYRKWNIVCTL